MQQWEYLVVLIDRAGRPRWEDSMGRSGDLGDFDEHRGSGYGNPGALLNELGEQGWEPTGTDGEYLYLKRPRM